MRERRAHPRVTQVLLVGVGGALGAVARYGVAGLVQRRFPGDFPAGTLAVNALGCLLIGGLMALAEGKHLARPDVLLFLTTGILGGFTTFSAFGHETFQLLRQGAAGLAMGNVAANVGLGALAVWLGRVLAKGLGA